jgi:hypothetical protein
LRGTIGKGSSSSPRGAPPVRSRTTTKPAAGEDAGHGRDPGWAEADEEAATRKEEAPLRPALRPALPGTGGLKPLHCSLQVPGAQEQLHIPHRPSLACVRTMRGTRHQAQSTKHRPVVAQVLRCDSMPLQGSPTAEQGLQWGWGCCLRGTRAQGGWGCCLIGSCGAGAAASPSSMNSSQSSSQSTAPSCCPACQPGSPASKRDSLRSIQHATSGSAQLSACAVSHSTHCASWASQG